MRPAQRLLTLVAPLGILSSMTGLLQPLQAQQPTADLPQVLSARTMLRNDRPTYRNFALDGYSNYTHHTLPQGAHLAYQYQPKAVYDGFGNHLITGFDLFNWTESRRPGQLWGSVIQLDEGSWTESFNYTAIARDGYGNWGYGAIVGHGLTARFTPLTLSQVDYNGLRVDLWTPMLKLTTLASRVERPYSPRGSDYDRVSQFHIEDEMLARESSLLLGGRAQAEFGAATLGLNLANVHTYLSTEPGNGIKGRLRPRTPLVDWAVVRFTDDSPRDGRGGAIVRDVVLIINGENRPDIVPKVIRNQARAGSQIGSFSSATGEFIGRSYHVPPKEFFRGRDDLVKYADYLYRLDHETGIDVSQETNLRGLLANFTMESPADILHADGEDQLAFLFDVTGEGQIESIEVEATVANDYRIGVSSLYEESPNAKGYAGRFKPEYYRTAIRAKGNVKDGSNLKRVRFKMGEDTSIFTYSADLSLQLVGLEINGEYARSRVYRRFPAEIENRPAFEESPRFTDDGAAYFINATRWYKNWRFGGEYFTMNPDFSTTMRTFIWDEAGIRDRRGVINRLSNDTMYWDLVQDNDDGDQFPDKQKGYTPGAVYRNDLDVDADGVHLSQDENNDGFPDINRNGDALPDYLEPFLMYEVESNDYAYGLDRNNNGEPDHREDDLDPDHPYDPDQRGYHLFGETNLTPNLTLALGRYDVEEIAGGRDNRSTYALLTYRRSGNQLLRRIFAENHFRRVEDSIPDEYNVLTEDRQFTEIFQYFVHNFYHGNRSFLSQQRQDPLWYENSYVNESYLENWLRPWSTLNLVQKIRLRLNWQRGGRQSAGRIERQRRLDHWTVVNRIDYTWMVGRLSIQPKFKFQMIRFVDQEQNRVMRMEHETMPILQLTLPLMRRTTARLGIQGWGPLPYRFENSARKLDDFERRTLMATITNGSRYFGYDLYTILGLHRDARKFDSRARKVADFDTLSFFIRALIGFPDYHQLL
jgi:hypothetical protein